MPMIGTIINTIAIIIGGAIGMVFGSKLPERMRSTITAGLGLFTALIGIQMFLDTEQALIVLGSLLLGGILGEWWRIEDRLKNLGIWLEENILPIINKERHLSDLSDKSGSNLSPDEKQNKSILFVKGFMTASLVYGIGPMAILGSIQDGLVGDYNLLVIKSVLDFFASIAFASSLGIGVLFSSLVILIYQGTITLLAAQVQSIISEPMMTEMTATGGVLLLGIAISSLLEIKTIRVGNFLPSLIIAPMIVLLMTSWANH
jgi:uncharacterized protein